MRTKALVYLAIASWILALVTWLTGVDGIIPLVFSGAGTVFLALPMFYRPRCSLGAGDELGQAAGASNLLTIRPVIFKAGSTAKQTQTQFGYVLQLDNPTFYTSASVVFDPAVFKFDQYSTTVMYKKKGDRGKKQLTGKGSAARGKSEAGLSEIMVASSPYAKGDDTLQYLQFMALLSGEPSTRSAEDLAALDAMRTGAVQFRLWQAGLKYNTCSSLENYKAAVAADPNMRSNHPCTLSKSPAWNAQATWA